MKNLVILNKKMATIKTEKQYEKVVERVEELLLVVDNKTSPDNRDFIELDLLSQLVADYEAQQQSVKIPALPEIIKSCMKERGLTQVALASLLDISVSRVNEILTGKCMPTFKLARKLHKQLKIDANMILA